MLMLGPLEISGILILGFVVSLLVGLTSVGSGALMTPILLLDFSSIVPRLFVVGTSTTQGTVVKFVGSARNYLRKAIKMEYAFIVAITGVPLGIVGAYYSAAFVTWPYFSPALAALLLAVAILILVLTKKNILNHKTNPKVDLRLRLKGAAIGAVVGVIAGLTGISTGSLLVASLMLLMKFPNRMAVGIAVFEGGLILFGATVVQLLLGHVDLTVTGLLIAGGIPGILIGSHFKDRANQTLLGYLIAAVIILESLRTLTSFFFGVTFF